MKKYMLMALVLNVLYFFWIFTFGRHQLPFLIMFINVIGIIAIVYVCKFLHGVSFVVCAIFGSYASSLIAMVFTRMVLYPVDQWGHSMLSPQNLMFPILSMGWIYGFLCILLWSKYKKVRDNGRG